MLHLDAIYINKGSSLKGVSANNLTTAGLICLEKELGIPTVDCMHSHNHHGSRILVTCTQGTLYDIYKGLGLSSLCASYQMVFNQKLIM